MNIVIIEDEKLTAKDLIKSIKAVEPAMQVTAQLATVAEAITYFSTLPDIDLIFSDIQLGDGLSFEIFEQVKIDTPIIFCTAFNEYALKAFDTSSIDYILKPFSTAAIKKAIQKFKTITSKQNSNEPAYAELFESIRRQLQLNKLPGVIIHQGEKIIPVAGDKIALFYIDKGNVWAYTFQQKKNAVTLNLEELENKFTPYFFRANRQFLINRNAVKEASQHFNRKVSVQLTIPFAEQILVPKEKVTPFLEWLANQ